MQISLSILSARVRLCGAALVLLMGVLLGACTHRGDPAGFNAKPAAPVSSATVRETVEFNLYADPLAADARAARHQPAAARDALPNTATSQISGKAWSHHKLPGKRSTLFEPMTHDRRLAVLARAQSSASLLRNKLRVEPRALGALKFSWKVPQAIAGADVSERDLDDAPVRLVLAFEGDTSKFSTRNALLSELSRTITGEPLPYATLMYVWCNTREQGSVVLNPRTDRIRKIVLESGSQNLNKWLDYERDIRADFIKAFGEEPGALLGVALMTDTDNTQSNAMAYYGPVALTQADALK